MQIEHPNFLIKIYFVNIKQTTQLQLVPEDKVAILWMRFPTFALKPDLHCVANKTAEQLLLGRSRCCAIISKK